MDRIVVVRGGALGDGVVTLPAIRNLTQGSTAQLCVIGSPYLRRLALPDVFLDLGSAQNTWLFGENGNLDPTAPAGRLLATADLVLAYTPPESSSALSPNIQAICSGTLLTWNPQPTLEDRHIVDHLLEPLRRADIPTATRTPIINASEPERERIRAMLPQRRSGQPLVLLHPGSGGAHKRWPLESFHALAQELATDGLSCAMVCGPVELETICEAGQSTDVPLIRQSSLPDLIGLTDAADLFIGNDSGPAHVCAAVSTPTLALFGPTNPVIWGPLGSHTKTLHAPGGILKDLGVDCVHSAALSMLSG